MGSISGWQDLLNRSIPRGSSRISSRRPLSLTKLSSVVEFNLRTHKIFRLCSHFFHGHLRTLLDSQIWPHPIRVDSSISTYDHRRKIWSHDDDIRFQTWCVVMRRVSVKTHIMLSQQRLRLNCVHGHLRTLLDSQIWPHPIRVDSSISTYYDHRRKFDLMTMIWGSKRDVWSWELVSRHVLCCHNSVYV